MWVHVNSDDERGYPQAEGGILQASVVTCLVVTVTEVQSGKINFIIQNIITLMYNRHKN